MITGGIWGGWIQVSDAESERSAMLYTAAAYFELEAIKYYMSKVKPALGLANKALFRAQPKSTIAPVFIALHSQSKKLISAAEHVARSSMTRYF